MEQVPEHTLLLFQISHEQAQKVLEIQQAIRVANKKLTELGCGSLKIPYAGLRFKITKHAKLLIFLEEEETP